jgi:hypothetical protein
MVWLRRTPQVPREIRLHQHHHLPAYVDPASSLLYIACYLSANWKVHHARGKRWLHISVIQLRELATTKLTEFILECRLATWPVSGSSLSSFQFSPLVSLR